MSERQLTSRPRPRPWPLLLWIGCALLACGAGQAPGSAAERRTAARAAAAAPVLPGSPAQAAASGDQESGGLALYEPDAGRVLHLVGTMLRQEDVITDYERAVGSELLPAGYAVWIALQGTRGWQTDLDRAARALRQARQSGLILNMALSFGFDARAFGTATDSDFATGEDFDARVDELADLIQRSGVPVLLRVGTEVNGVWSGHHPYVFPQAYRKLVERFRARGVTNVAYVWCIVPQGDPDIFGRNSSGQARWYPGDDVVDWFGLDVFDRIEFTPGGVAGRKGSERDYEVTATLLDTARRLGKPVIVGETTPRRMQVPGRRDDPLGKKGLAIWERWFVPFSAFLDRHPEIKAVTMLPVDWTKTTAWPDWGDARLHQNPELLRHWRDELRKPRWIHRSGLPAAGGGDGAAGDGAGPPTDDGRPAAGQRPRGG